MYANRFFVSKMSSFLRLNGIIIKLRRKKLRDLDRAIVFAYGTERRIANAIGAEAAENPEVMLPILSVVP